MIRHASPEAGIPDCDTGVAHQAPPFCAFDGASSKEFTKVCLGKPEDPFQSWKEQRFVLRRKKALVAVFFLGRKNSWLELRHRDNRRPPVPWTNVLADIAAENMISHRLAKLFRDGTSQLDGQVRNTLSRIQNVGFDKSLRRTSVETTPATPAQIRRRQLVRSERRFQIESSEYDAEKKEGAEHLVEQ